MANPTRPAESAVEITTSNTAEFAPTRAVYVGTSGNLRVDIGGEDITFAGVAAGVAHPLAVTRIYATGTTAADIVALY